MGYYKIIRFEMRIVVIQWKENLVYKLTKINNLSKYLSINRMEDWFIYRKNFYLTNMNYFLQACSVPGRDKIRDMKIGIGLLKVEFDRMCVLVRE